MTPHHLAAYKKDRNDALVAALPNTLMLLIVPLMVYMVLRSLAAATIFTSVSNIIWLLITAGLLYFNFLQIKKMGGFKRFWEITKAQWENVKDQQGYYTAAKHKVREENKPARPDIKKKPAPQKTKVSDSDVQSAIDEAQDFINKK